MTTLLIAEHDNKSLKDATAKALTAAVALGAAGACAGRGQGLPSPPRMPPRKLAGVAKVLIAEADAARAHAGRADGGADRGAGAVL